MMTRVPRVMVLLIAMATAVPRSEAQDVKDVEDPCDRLDLASGLHSQACEVHLGPDFASVLQMRKARKSPTTFLECNVEKSIVNHSNLGGMGPDLYGSQTIVLDNFGTYGGDTVRLVISNRTKYEPKNSDSNGRNGKFGIINVKTGTETKLLFDFYINGQLASMDDVALSFFDLDSTNNLKANETMGVFNTTPYFSKTLDPLTEVTYSEEQDGRYMFTSSKLGVGHDNPSDPMDLTDQQKMRSVQLVFVGVSHLDLSFGSVGGGNGGRNLMFGCRTNIKTEPTPSPTPSPVPKKLECNIENSNVSHSNLGGMGPDLGGSQTIVLDNFGTYGGDSVRLVISNRTKYEPKNSNSVQLNGVSGKFGMINVKTATETKLLFEFYINGKLASMDNMAFSFFDLDSKDDLNADERMGVYNTTPYVFKKLDPSTEVVHSVGLDGTDMFTSSTPGSGKDNPTDPMNMTDQQKRRSVQFVFVGKSHLDLSFGSVGRGAGGRNLMYACGSNMFEVGDIGHDLYVQE
jgi:hypothetical protein